MVSLSILDVLIDIYYYLIVILICIFHMTDSEGAGNRHFYVFVGQIKYGNLFFVLQFEFW